MANPPVIDYSSRDYSSLVSDLISLAQQLLPEWTNITNPTDFGAVLLDLYAYVGDITNYYIDRIANELFLKTAQRTQSVLNIAQMFAYTPISLTPATVTLTFTTSGTQRISAGTQVSTTPTSGNPGVVFETDTGVTIVGATTGTVTATQGITVTGEILTDSCDGSLNNSFTLFNGFVIDSSIALTVSDATGVDVTWRHIDDLLSASGSAQVYTTKLNENSVTTIEFGDDVFGAAPMQGSTITATYRVGNGVLGNVAAGSLVELVNPIDFVTAVTNVSPAISGTDAESTDSMRSSIPKSLFALNRAVTLKDFAALAIQVPGIAKANATATVYTSVLLYIAPSGGGVPTGPSSTAGTNKYAVDQYLADKKLINVTVTYGDPTYVNVNIAATINVLPSYYQPTVLAAIQAALGGLLSFANVDFGQSITISQIYHTLQAVTGVDYVVLTKLVRGDAATQAGVTTITTTAGEIPKLGSITLAVTGGVSS